MRSMELEEYRQIAGVTQEVMAAHMGLPIRTYENIVSGRVEFRPVHEMAARWALMQIAIEKGDDRIITTDISNLIEEAAKLVAKKKGGQ